VKSITVATLFQMIKEQQVFQLIDVREQDEHNEFNIGGTLMPLGQITRNLYSIAKDKPVIFYCRKGIRSQFAIQKLQEKYPFNNLVNLIGGTEAWKREIEKIVS
jgi:adenylyltransferase/sulfurtransferase